MRSIVTTRYGTTRSAVRAVELTRAQAMGLMLLVCVPLPALSLGAFLAPLPEVMERGAASFLPFVEPTLEEGPGRVVRKLSARPGKAPARNEGSSSPSASTSSRSWRNPPPSRTVRAESPPSTTSLRSSESPTTARKEAEKQNERDASTPVAESTSSDATVGSSTAAAEEADVETKEPSGKAVAGENSNGKADGHEDGQEAADVKKEGGKGNGSEKESP